MILASCGVLPTSPFREQRHSRPTLFGLTGTPINRADRNAFFAFGAEEDDYGYLSRYGFEESDPRRRDQPAAHRAAGRSDTPHQAKPRALPGQR